MNRNIFALALALALALAGAAACSEAGGPAGTSRTPETPDDDDDRGARSDESRTMEESRADTGSASKSDAGARRPSTSRADAAARDDEEEDPPRERDAQAADDAAPAVPDDEDPPQAGGPAASCDENMQKNPADADPCTAPLRPGEDRLCQFSYGGQMRKFYLYAPPSYNACEPAALVMDCHGATESAEVHVGKAKFSADAPLGYGSSWRRAVQGDNVIVATPEGVNLFWSKAEDPAFLNKVADMVEAVAKVDPEKRYLTGISMGGMVSVQTGCADAKRWRGMVPIAMLSNTCPSISRPIPHMAFHAETDSITSYADDRKLAEQMVKLNKCDPTPEIKYYGGPMSAPDPVCFAMPYGPGSPDAKDPYAVPLTACPSDRPQSKCEIWTGCEEGSEVVFCTIEAAKQRYGGHLLYTNDTGMNLAALAWPFLKKFW